MTRCNHEGCRKKLKITNIPCKCGFTFCMNHRLPMEHNCNTLEKERIEHKQYLQEMMKECAFKKIQEI